MKNPILETFGRGDLATAEKVLVRRDGESWLYLTPRDDVRGTWEGAYRCTGGGPCISFPFANTHDEVLKGMAQAILGSSQPKRGQIATIAATLLSRITFEPII